MSAGNSYDHWKLDYGYELFIAFVSVLSIFNMVLIYIPGIDKNAAAVVGIINLVLTLIFLFDFILRICTTPSRSRYFLYDFGWADLLACIPYFRIFRIFRILKAYRLFHRYGMSSVMTYLTVHRAESALFILVSAVLMIVEAGSFFVLLAEQGAKDANIITAPDALWWVYVTMTTVGYGDHYPVTNTGRLVGILVMTTGVGIFATFAGFISNKLLVPSGKKKKKKVAETIPAGSINESFTELHRLLAEREQIDSAISALVATMQDQVHYDPAHDTDPRPGDIG
ncbi:MAG: ion transporter [Methanospirillaceae archaeon]|nr:ion transporter [Methanospirillaceae archaeon]